MFNLRNDNNRSLVQHDIWRSLVIKLTLPLASALHALENGDNYG
jgi:hypothetical protein